MNIGIDLHDTLTYAPEFFRRFCSLWRIGGNKVYIVTGTPEEDKEHTEKILSDLGFQQGIQFDDILMGYNYDKNKMDISHFNRMKKHKLNLLLNNKIDVYFDDNPYYVSYLRNHGIIVFETIVSDKYQDDFAKKDKYFTCHLQKHQFDFIKSLTNDTVKKS